MRGQAAAGGGRRRVRARAGRRRAGRASHTAATASSARRTVVRVMDDEPLGGAPPPRRAAAAAAAAPGPTAARAGCHPRRGRQPAQRRLQGDGGDLTACFLSTAVTAALAAATTARTAAAAAAPRRRRRLLLLRRRRRLGRRRGRGRRRQQRAFAARLGAAELQRVLARGGSRASSSRGGASAGPHAMPTCVTRRLAPGQSCPSSYTCVAKREGATAGGSQPRKYAQDAKEGRHPAVHLELRHVGERAQLERVDAAECGETAARKGREGAGWWNAWLPLYISETRGRDSRGG